VRDRLCLFLGEIEELVLNLIFVLFFFGADYTGRTTTSRLQMLMKSGVGLLWVRVSVRGHVCVCMYVCVWV